LLFSSRGPGGRAALFTHPFIAIYKIERLVKKKMCHHGGRIRGNAYDIEVNLLYKKELNEFLFRHFQFDIDMNQCLNMTLFAI
jgi:hypothetical protein